MTKPTITPYLFGFICFGLIASCKKKEPLPDEKIETRTPVEVINDITTSVAEADSISLFVDALKTLSLKPEDVASGLTVFAPLNPADRGAQAVNKLASNGAIDDFTANDLTDSVLMDHLVSGVFSLEALTDGKKLTTLSGNELLVTIVEGNIWINGVPISDEITSDDQQAIFTVKNPLTGTAITDALQTTTIEVTVWDAMGWGPDRPKGIPSTGAEVKLYASQADYANQIAAYNAMTDTMGKAVFKDIVPATYFIEVSQEDRSNILVKSNQPESGVFTGLAIESVFQSQEEAESSALQPGAAPGNFKWVDVNADSKIDNGDFVTMPSDQATAADRLVTKVDVLIGYAMNTEHKPLTEEGLAAELATAEVSLANWNSDLAVMDALLVADVDINELQPPLNTRFQRIGDFSFNPALPLFAELWHGGYGMISRLNALEKRAPQGGSSDKAKLKVFRAFTYLQLLTYFGNIPLSDENGQLTNQNPDKVADFIRSELEAARGSLPQSAPSDGTLSRAVADMLSARLALLKKDYTRVAAYTGGVMTSGHHSLTHVNDAFQPNSPEMIWKSPAQLSGPMKAYFHDRASMPFLRLREAYLMFVEASLALGNTRVAQDACNTLMAAAQIEPLPPNASSASISDANQSLWSLQMEREGVQYANIIRWERAATAFGPRGYNDPMHRLMPIPQSIIDANPQMIQNPGY